MSPKSLHLIAEKAGFTADAFLFVQRGLDFTVRQVHGEPPARAVLDDEDDQPDRHISGQQLCMGLKDYAKREYGLLAKSVLARWHVHHSEDFGRIVFAMVDAGLLHKTQEDTLEDFVGVFNFDEAFSDKLLLG